MQYIQVVLKRINQIISCNFNVSRNLFAARVVWAYAIPESVEQKPSIEILTGTKQNDRKCQGQFYKQFYSYGMGVCLRYTASREEGVEVLHDGFLKVFLHIGDYEIEKPFIPWFRRILINTAINHYRKNHRESRVMGLDSVPDPPDLQQNALAELTYQEMIHLIQNLPIAYRTVFNLYAIEGYSHEEIAQMLHISVGTSKSNLSRARANLRNLLIRSHERGLVK